MTLVAGSLSTLAAPMGEAGSVESKRNETAGLSSRKRSCAPVSSPACSAPRPMRLSTTGVASVSMRCSASSACTSPSWPRVSICSFTLTGAPCSSVAQTVSTRVLGPAGSAALPATSSTSQKCLTPRSHSSEASAWYVPSGGASVPGSNGVSRIGATSAPAVASRPPNTTPESRLPQGTDEEVTGCAADARCASRRGPVGASVVNRSSAATAVAAHSAPDVDWTVVAGDKPVGREDFIRAC